MGDRRRLGQRESVQDGPAASLVAGRRRDFRSLRVGLGGPAPLLLRSTPSLLVPAVACEDGDTHPPPRVLPRRRPGNCSRSEAGAIRPAATRGAGRAPKGGVRRAFGSKARRGAACGGIVWSDRPRRLARSLLRSACRLL